MPILNQWILDITTDQVLRAQGSDPDAIRSRRPKLVSATEDAIKRGQQLLHPTVLFETYEVNRFRHERLDLNPIDQTNVNPYLSGQLIAQHLSRAQEIIVMVCTIGSELDNTVSSLFKTDPVVALALDGFGSAAVEYLGVQACNYFENQVKFLDLETSMPINPGMIGWPVDIGQPQLFSLLDSESINISLTESCMMVPNKSISIVLGIGKEMQGAASPCEYCGVKDVCKYQNHYAKK